jgi:hypothetical protein
MSRCTSSISNLNPYRRYQKAQANFKMKIHIFLFSIRALPYCRISSPWHRAERLHNVENLKRYVQYVARNTALWASYHSTNSYFKLSVVRVRQGSLHIPPCFCVMYKLYFQVLLLAKSCIAHTCMSTWAN